jgi:hypothetical protein
MGNSCCSYNPADPNSIPVNGADAQKTVKMTTNNIMSPEVQRTYELAKANEKSVVKIQANVKGMLVRKEVKSAKKGKMSRRVSGAQGNSKPQ